MDTLKIVITLVILVGGLYLIGPILDPFLTR